LGAQQEGAVEKTTQIPVYCYDIVRLPRKLAMRGGDHLQPFDVAQGDTFIFLQAYDLSDLSALIFCLLFHQGKSKMK